LANLNRIILVGRLSADPESRATGEGLAIANYRLAVNRPFSDGADMIDIVAWGKQAEISVQQLKKGSLALVDGRIQNRSFANQAGQKIYVTEVVASHVAPLDNAPAAAAAAGLAGRITKTEEDEEFIDDSDLAGELPF